MAVVLEVERRGQPVPTFVRVSDRELADGVWLGRGYDCDVLLADPHIEARHARLVAMDGRIVVSAVGDSKLSVDKRAVLKATSVSSGATLTLGHTRVRLFESDHPVPPAQSTDDFLDGLAWLARPRLLVPLLLLTFAAAAIDNGLRQLGQLDALSAALTGVAPVLLCIAWAGLWALVTRVLRHEARFSSHLAIALVASIASLLLDFAAELVEYNAQSVVVREWFDHVALAALLAVLLAMHVRVTMGQLRWYWQTPAVAVALSFVGYSILTDVATERDFVRSPEYASIVLPDGLRWRGETVGDDFAQRAEALFDMADTERARLAEQDKEQDTDQDDEPAD